MTKSSQDIPGLIAHWRAEEKHWLKAARTMVGQINIDDALERADTARETADALAAPKSEGAVTGEPKVWIGRDDLEFLSRNPMSTATVWGADRAGNRNHVALYLAPSNPLPAAREEVGVTEAMVEAAIEAYEKHTPSDYRYSATALRHALEAALRQVPAAPSQEAVWPDFVAPSKYDNPAPGWTDPELPDFRKIWEAARRCGYAVGLHGSMKRDCDLIATPWAENALAPESLIDELCKALNAREVGIREAKPGCRVAVNLQVDGWVKLIDLSIVGVPQSPLVTAVPTLTWPDGTVYQFSIEQGRRAIAAALASPQGQESGVTKP